MTDAKKNAATARSIFKNICAELQPYASDSMEERRGGYVMDMRCPDLFTDRAGCEDDDWPNFTGLDHVVEVAKRHAAAKGFKLVNVCDSEKMWFDIEIAPNN